MFAGVVNHCGWSPALRHWRVLGRDDNQEPIEMPLARLGGPITPDLISSKIVRRYPVREVFSLTA